jgi:hypothetical protein
LSWAIDPDNAGRLWELFENLLRESVPAAA